MSAGDVLGLIGVVLAGYLLGSIPTGVIVGRLWKGIDVRQHGSTHTGGLNTLRVVGATAGILAGLGDVAKGVVAILVARLLGPEPWSVPLAGFAAVVGHNWSLPGIRENGGQYTHAALWAVWAFAELGQGDRAEALFRLLNPIYHSDTPEKMERYRVEPYVVAADVYGVPPHTGRGGWTWYTGSASWMYRLGVEAILGLRRTDKTLQVNPCIPKHWQGYEMTYRIDSTSYHIHVENPDGVNRGVKQVTLDGRSLPHSKIPLIDDGQRHEVHLLMGNPSILRVTALAGLSPTQSASQHE